ncbi:MAG TPA: putative sugar O-methyltransferase [Burkholderiales bacterium]|nr:putative sugar O-methyltransferase [Burkholderiales bacterium]
MKEADIAVLRGMYEHVARMEEALRPSGFWVQFSMHNDSMLLRHGIENFKRTVNQNYFNWVPLSAGDNQYRRVAAYYAAHQDAEALKVELEDWALLRVGFLQENPFADPGVRNRYAKFVGMLWHHVRHSEPNGILEQLSEPELGNPIRTRLAGRLISQDLANSVKERNALFHGWNRGAAEKRLRIGELGAGYGRVGHVLLATGAAQYVVVDVPPALFVSQWYLSRLFPERRVFRFRRFESFDKIADEIAACDIVFLAPDQFGLLPDRYFDAFLTISSLAEMTWAQISRYVALMASKTKHRVYVKQWRRWTNPADQMTVTQENYNLPRGWQKVLDRVDSVQDEFFETVWQAG